MARSLCGVPGLINDGSAHSRTGSETIVNQGSKHSELLVSVDVARAGYYFDYPLLLFNLRPAVYRLGAARLNASIDSFSVTIF